MAIGRISGPMLFSNLERQGVDLAFQSNLLYLDVNNLHVGIINDSPQYPLDVSGNVKLSNIIIQHSTFSSNTGVMYFGSNANVSISGGSTNYVLSTDGSGNLKWASPADLSVSISTAILGNVIQMGSNSSGYLVSNAVALTTTTTVTDGIAQLNQVLGKLVPPAPPTAYVTLDPVIDEATPEPPAAPVLLVELLPIAPAPPPPPPPLNPKVLLAPAYP